MAFPAIGAPSWYGSLYADQKFGIYYQGDDVHLICVAANSEATDYSVRDRHGTVVSSGSVSWAPFGVYFKSVDPVTPPVGGWPLGWYRVSITGPYTDATWGTNMGSMNFCVFKETAGFVVERDSAVGFPPPIGNQSNDPIWRGMCGVGPTRMNINPTNTPNGSQEDNIDNMLVVAEFDGAFRPSDQVRPWEMWCAFSSRTWDNLSLNIGASPAIYCLTKTGSIDGSQVFVGVEAGSVSGFKIEVCFPDALTVVETYDNQASSTAAVASINASSSYVQAYVGTVSGVPDFVSPAAIGSDFFNGVVQTVQALYPLGVTRYEGPLNEPALSVQSNPVGSYAHAFYLFTEAVHQGNPDAVAIGPSTVRITGLDDTWRPFLQSLQDRNFVPDGLAFHAYNTVLLGDINEGRYQIEQFIAMLDDFGLKDIELWQTESNNVIATYNGVYHPNFSAAVMNTVLLFEQYGIPREKNPYWYDWSHGFWPFACFAITQGAGLHPYAVYYRVLAEETIGKTHHHKIDFGNEAANSLFFGSVYAEPAAVDSTSVAVLLSQSYMAEEPTVTLDVVGEVASLVLVDAVGVETTLAVTAGQVVVPVEEYPSYLRLPAGVCVTVAGTSLLGESVSPSLSAVASTMTIGGVASTALGDNSPIRLYEGYPGGAGISYSTSALPDSAEIIFSDDTVVDAVVVHGGPCWQFMPAIYEGAIEYLDSDDTTWVSASTISQSGSSFLNCNSSIESGCTRETYWRPQTKYVHKFSVPVTTKGVRVTASSLSYGSEPDSEAQVANASGMADPKLAVIDIMVLSSSTPSLSLSTYDEEVLADSPNGYWPNDTGTGNLISAVNSPAMDATLTGSPLRAVAGLTTDGSKGTKFATGSNSYWSVADSALLDVAGTCTYELWFSPTSRDAGAQGLMGKGNTATMGTLFWNSSSADGHLYWGRDGSAYAGNPEEMGTGSTYHIVATQSGTTYKLYINGELVSTGTGTALSNNNDPFFIGDGGAASGGTCQGTVHKPAIYPTALSADRVRAHYLAGLAANTPGVLVAPEVVGTPVVGQQIATKFGFFSNFPTAVTHQWQRSSDGLSGWENISSAVGAEYVVSESDEGAYLRRVSVASNTAGSTGSVESDVFGPIAGSLPDPPPDESRTVLLAGVKSSTSNPTNNISDVNKGWSNWV